MTKEGKLWKALWKEIFFRGFQTHFLSTGTHVTQWTILEQTKIVLIFQQTQRNFYHMMWKFCHKPTMAWMENQSCKWNQKVPHMFEIVMTSWFQVLQNLEYIKGNPRDEWIFSASQEAPGHLSRGWRVFMRQLLRKLHWTRVRYHNWKIAWMLNSQLSETLLIKHLPMVIHNDLYERLQLTILIG